MANRMTHSSPEKPTPVREAPTGADKAARDNRAVQLNPNNDAYWRSRGKSKPGSN